MPCASLTSLTPSSSSLHITRTPSVGQAISVDGRTTNAISASSEEQREGLAASRRHDDEETIVTTETTARDRDRRERLDAIYVVSPAIVAVKPRSGSFKKPFLQVVAMF